MKVIVFCWTILCLLVSFFALLIIFLFLFFALLINIATVQHCNFVLTDFTLEVDNVLIGYLGIFFPSHHFLVFIYLFIHFLVFKTACLFVLSLQFTFISVELPWDNVLMPWSLLSRGRAVPLCEGIFGCWNLCGGCYCNGVDIGQRYAKHPLMHRTASYI